MFRHTVNILIRKYTTAQYLCVMMLLFFLFYPCLPDERFQMFLYSQRTLRYWYFLAVSVLPPILRERDESVHIVFRNLVTVHLTLSESGIQSKKEHKILAIFAQNSKARKKLFP